MQKVKIKSRSTMIALAIGFVALGFISAAHADEQKLSSLNTSLSSTTISGYVNVGAQYSLPTDPFAAPSVTSFALSPSAVPEPTTWLLLSAGALALLLAKRKSA